MFTHLRRRSYGAIGAEPWPYPYRTPKDYRTSTGEVITDPSGALARPLVLGPGWYKGAQISYTPSPEDTIMRSYGNIANAFGPPRAVLPVIPPIGGVLDPHGPVTAFTQVPKGLPIIQPGPGWHIGPSIFSALPVGAVEGDDLPPLRIYNRRDDDAYGASNLSMPLIVQGTPARFPLTAAIQPYMTPITGYGNAIVETLDEVPYAAVSVASVVATYLTWGTSKRLLKGQKTTTMEKVAVVGSSALSAYSIYRYFKG
jgi:hypothetical protein